MPHKRKNAGGGVSITSSHVVVSGDVVGRDKVVGAKLSRADIDRILGPLEETIPLAAPQNRQPATATLETLKAELEKGSRANDPLIARLIGGFIDLVPKGVGTVAKVFSMPILTSVAGPATKSVLHKLLGS